MSLDDKTLSSQIRRHATRYVAPDSLRARIRTQVALSDASRAAQQTQAPAPRRRWFGFGRGAAAVNVPAFGLRTASLGFALGLACAFFLLPAVQRFNQTRDLDTELVSDHVRALRTGPLYEVVSSDRHTVKPWFQGRIDYAPPVFDFADEGFPLKGGRVEHVRGNLVATLAYSRDRHMIDLFVWPTDAKADPLHSVNRGFNVVYWADGSMQYWAVSDVEAAELQRFAQLWRTRAASH
jgi:anti-sigma factor RsiW